ncbi:MAG: Spore coat protein JB [Lachnoclostridium sp.]|jgi:spore coat protein JB
MNQAKCDSMKKLQAVSFVLDDLRLFLDTHPFDKEALASFEKYKNEREQALEEYENDFGPVLAYCVKEEAQWSWVNTPWPWEGEV